VILDYPSTTNALSREQVAQMDRWVKNTASQSYNLPFKKWPRIDLVRFPSDAAYEKRKFLYV
jgi:hypothetical protein